MRLFCNNKVWLYLFIYLVFVCRSFKTSEKPEDTSNISAVEKQMSINSTDLESLCSGQFSHCLQTRSTENGRDMKLKSPQRLINGCLAHIFISWGGVCKNSAVEKEDLSLDVVKVLKFQKTLQNFKKSDMKVLPEDSLNSDRWWVWRATDDESLRVKNRNNGCVFDDFHIF